MNGQHRHTRAPGSCCLALLAFLTLSATASEAEAQIPPVQWQILAVGSTDVGTENPSAELQINISIYGIGLALGLGGQGFWHSEEQGYAGGALFDIALQLRPFMLAAAVREPYRPTYHYFDPHIDAGGLIGVIGAAGEGAEFRGVFFVGASFDIGIPTGHYHMANQLLLTAGYRYVPVQSQSAPAHFIVFGLGYRGGY